MALVLVAGILAVAGIAGYVSGEKEQNHAENAADFTDEMAGSAQNNVVAESNVPMADEMTGYNADLVQKILSMIENGSLALEDFEDEGSMKHVTDENVSEVDADVNTNDQVQAAVETDEEAAEEGTDLMDAEMAGNVQNAGLQSTDKIAWPVRGEIIMDYSMDQTTYYPTLQEYKCNPSVLIQSEEDADVTSVFGGTVTDVYEDAQLGNVVKVSLGNGYEASYGQLKEVDVAIGDTVTKGEVIGTVNQPTRYYSVEGSHLNFELTQDDVPVDPVDYLE